MMTIGRAEAASEISRHVKNCPNKNATNIPKFIAIGEIDNKVPRTDFSLLMCRKMMKKVGDKKINIFGEKII